MGIRRSIQAFFRNLMKRYEENHRLLNEADEDLRKNNPEAWAMLHSFDNYRD